MNAYCKICHDAGKSKLEYTSHYAKDRPGPQGVLTCPYMLSVKCGYCRQTGHTPKYCPNLKQKQQKEARFPILKKEARLSPILTTNDSQNAFSKLNYDSDSSSVKSEHVSKPFNWYDTDSDDN